MQRERNKELKKKLVLTYFVEFY